jgi:ssRNA-specific RNase YbeY (16S rRNA maturation enzyme)
VDKQFRKLDKVTDVLFFVFLKKRNTRLEIYIASAQKTEKQAQNGKKHFYDELKRLRWSMGSLHLASFDPYE